MDVSKKGKLPSLKVNTSLCPFSTTRAGLTSGGWSQHLYCLVSHLIKSLSALNHNVATLRMVFGGCGVDGLLTLACMSNRMSAGIAAVQGGGDHNGDGKGL